MHSPPCHLYIWSLGRCKIEYKRIASEKREISLVSKKMGDQCNTGDRKGKGILVDDDNDKNPNGRLEDMHVYDNLPPLFGPDDNVMLALQETQTPSSPVVEKEKQKPDQPPKDKPSIHLYTTRIKPRLLWTPQLHALFTDAVNVLGGASKATPKALHAAMNLDGLTVRMVKSHLQKFRKGEVTVNESKEIPKISSQQFRGSKISTFNGKQPINTKRHVKSMDSKALETIGAKWEEQGQLYQEPQEAIKQYIDDEKETRGVPTIFCKNLAGVGTTATTLSVNTTQKNTDPKYNSLERTEECLRLHKQASSSRGYQPQNKNVAYSETRSYLTSDGNSFPSYISTNANNVQLSLKEQTPGFLPRDVASANTNLKAALGFSFPTYNGTNAFDVNDGLKGQPQSFLRQNADYNYQTQNTTRGNPSQNIVYGYHPPNAASFATNAFDVNVCFRDQPQSLPQNADYNNQPQTAMRGSQSQIAPYGYQPPNATNFATNAFDVNVYLKDQSQSFLPQSATPGNHSQNAGYGYQPPNAANFTTNAFDVNVCLKDQPQRFLPQNVGYNNQLQSATHVNQSQNAGYGYQPPNAANFATNASDVNVCLKDQPLNFLPQNAGYNNQPQSTTHTAENKISNGNYSGSTTESALHNFTTCIEKYSGRANYPAANFPTSYGNYSGRVVDPVINDLPKSEGSGTAYHPEINDLTTSKGNYSGNMVYPVINNLTSCVGNYSGSEGFPVINSSTSSEGNYSGSVAFL